jgi:hypothetical protein
MVCLEFVLILPACTDAGAAPERIFNHQCSMFNAQVEKKGLTT